MVHIGDLHPFTPASALSPLGPAREVSPPQAGVGGEGDPLLQFKPDPALDLVGGGLVLSQGDDVPREVLQSRADSFQHKVNQPARESVASGKAVSLDAIEHAGKAMETALKAGVDMTRSTFLRKVVGAVASVIALGVMVAATVATAGAAAPALAVACLSTLSYAGDAACAYREWKNAQASAANEKLPYTPLPCGPSAVGNLAFWVVRGQCQDDDAALAIAHKVEVGFALGLMAFSLATCVVPPELQLAEEAVKFASLGLKSLMYAHATLSSAAAREGGDEVERQGHGSPAHALRQAFDTLNQVLGPDDEGRNERLQQFLADHHGNAAVRNLLEHVMDEGQYSPEKTKRLFGSYERAIEGLEPVPVNFLAVTVSVVSLAIVGRAVAAPGSE